MVACGACEMNLVCFTCMGQFMGLSTVTILHRESLQTVGASMRLAGMLTSRTAMCPALDPTGKVQGRTCVVETSNGTLVSLGLLIDTGRCTTMVNQFCPRTMVHRTGKTTG